MELAEQLEGIAARAAGHAEREEVVTAVIPAESSMGRVYLCAYRRGDDETTWLLLDTDGEPVVERAAVRDAASLVALAELAAIRAPPPPAAPACLPGDGAGGGDREALRAPWGRWRRRKTPRALDER